MKRRTSATIAVIVAMSALPAALHAQVKPDGTDGLNQTNTKVLGDEGPSSKGDKGDVGQANTKVLGDEGTSSKDDKGAVGQTNTKVLGDEGQSSKGDKGDVGQTNTKVLGE